MAAAEMKDYLSGVDYDNNETLSVQPSSIIIEEGEFKDAIHIGDDGSEERIKLGTDIPVFYVSLYWDNQDTDDIGTVFDFYFDSTKGSGRTKTFKWLHPTDGHTYVVRFESKLNRTIMNPEIHSIKSCKLRVLGHPTRVLNLKGGAHDSATGKLALP